MALNIKGRLSKISRAVEAGWFSRLPIWAVILAITASAIYGQTPSREYIRLGGRVVATENSNAGSISMVPSTASLTPSQTQQFTATVLGLQNTSVTWTLDPAGLGVVSTDGLYTAPSSIATQQTVAVIATSQWNPQLSASATVTLSPAAPQISVTINPASASLYAQQSQQFTATVTGTLNTAVTWGISPSGTGSITGAGLYTAPTSIPSQQIVTATATSQADPTKSASASVTLLPPPAPVSVTINPGSASLYALQSQQFTAAVMGTLNTAVTWSLSPSGTGSITGAGLYTAPASIATQQTVTVTATSQADPTKSASASVTLLPQQYPNVTPGGGSVFSVGQTVNFTVFGPGQWWTTMNDWLTFSIAPTAAQPVSPFANSCYITYRHAERVVYLVPDNGGYPEWGVLGSQTVLGQALNSRCSVSLAGATATLTSSGLSLVLPVTFKNAYVGQRSLWVSSSHPNWDWRSFGPATIVTAPTISPSGGSTFTTGQPTSFTLFGPGQWWTTANDWLSMLVSPSEPSGGNFPYSCYVTYQAGTATVYLSADYGTSMESGVIGSAAVLGQNNSQCSVSLASSSASLGANGLTLNLSVTFKSAFAGSRSLWVSSSHPTWDWHSYGWVTIQP